METRVYFDREIDRTVLNQRRIAIIGYGAQGRAHALNLRDSGCAVTIGQRSGSGFQQAIADGFEPVPIAVAAAECDLICLMLPDEIHGPVFRDSIVENLDAGDVVLCCHGFSLHYRTIEMPAEVSSILVAPKGAGHMVRTAFENGGGVPCLVGVGPGVDREPWLPLALAYAAAIGGGRSGIIETDVREETETDLFGEQAVLCGGVSHLAIAAFETLVAAGYREEIAYFECVHELKLVVDLLHRGGLAFMRDHISNTAEYGDYTRGPQLIDDHVREKMKQVLADIQDGTFARQWIQEYEDGSPEFTRMRRQQQELSVQKAGDALHRNLKLT